MIQKKTCHDQQQFALYLNSLPLGQHGFFLGQDPGSCPHHRALKTHIAPRAVLYPPHKEEDGSNSND